MSGPTIRVLSLLELLQSHGRLSGTELAARLGVDKRTVRRYIQALEQLGIPVTTEQGCDGGYMLVAGFKLPPMMFTNDETLALSLGLLAAHNLNLADTQVAISSVQAKLERVMPAKLKSRARAIADNIKVILPASDTETSGQHLAPLLDALEQQRSVTIRYASYQQAPVFRQVDPYGLLFRSGRWYMSGYCHLRQELRTFRLDRLQQIELLQQCFNRPANFDTAEHFTSSLYGMPGNLDVQVMLHTDKHTAAQAMGETASMLKPQAEGLLLSTRTDSCYCLAQWLSQLPFDFSIIEPPELKLALKQQAERLMNIAQR
ncbi:Predicted DNA-binding transcriptional regulator YafY, contains an HTH and WYL domains [Rheinheimera pacifica]|uniref:Predicted DNA-binding transcriptional regulator YafY, contains an HTH and WYL domains n=1 Tax=Rheinheimera pacifica TaxID=173990 RepID=A0A1H6KW10_9GAMM|nr:YafY family protein [Rheinheimera pacifica]SEH79970.1 Predicted DNA-binding transcriptional regulator YafY, contains an HTH and WYL domains [Rheinheimera pacifica]